MVYYEKNYYLYYLFSFLTCNVFCSVPSLQQLSFRKVLKISNGSEENITIYQKFIKDNPYIFENFDSKGIKVIRIIFKRSKF